MEEWKDIPGYEGIYQASTHGRIQSLDIWIREKNGKERLHKGRLLKMYKIHNGYLCVCLQTKGVRKHFLVHRLIALTFIPNPQCLDTVNHKDENKDNNYVDNLEWQTLYQNNRHGTRDDRMRKSLSKPVLQYTLSGVFMKEFESLAAVKRELGFNASSVNKAARGIYKSSNGYIWKYKTE